MNKLLFHPHCGTADNQKLAAVAENAGRVMMRNAGKNIFHWLSLPGRITGPGAMVRVLLFNNLNPIASPVFTDNSHA